MAETLYEFVRTGADLIKAREAERGSPLDDGPTAGQVTKLAASLQVVNDATDELPPSFLWELFRLSVEIEMSWLFPESDPLAEPMQGALRKVQKLSGDAFAASVPGQREDMEKFVNLSLVANAVKRRVILQGNRPSLRSLLSRFMHFLGGGKRQ